jgi:dTDP-4-amino-4,6-dideoxygalactose transaminase
MKSHRCGGLIVLAKLALLGGEKVRTQPFSDWPIYDEKEINALTEVCKSVWGGIGGSKKSEFEQKFAEMQGCAHGISVCNGTVAIEVALRAMGVGAGDEVIVTPYTFIASASSVLMVNAIPVFVDIDPDNYNIDPSKIEAAITEKTKAIIAVHIAGCPADMDGIMEVARRHNLLVLEDCAQAHLAEWRGKRVGSFGDAGTFSFQNSKNLTSGEGGIIVTNDQSLADKIWSVHNCGRVKEGRWYEHRVLGGNYRMTELQAALLLTQMERLPEQHAKRQANAAYLDRDLGKIPGIKPLVRDPRVTGHAYHLYIFRYDPSEFGGLPRAKFIQAVSAEGVPCGSGYVPLYREELFVVDPNKCPVGCGFYGRQMDYSKVFCPVTEKACDEESVWMFQTMLLGEKSDMDDVVAAIKKVRDNVAEIV